MFEAFRLVWIVLVDTCLSLDNAVMISAVANEVPEEEREKVKLYGIIGAVVARIVFAFCAGWLLQYTAFTLLGGAYLVLVAWRMWANHDKPETTQPDNAWQAFWKKHLSQLAVLKVIGADVMMSGDNVLAIAHTARGNHWLMAFGIALSIALMFVATKFVTWLLDTYPKAFYAAVGVVGATGLHMVWLGLFTRV